MSFDRFLARTTLVQLEEHDRIELDLDRAGVRVVRGSARLDGPGRVIIERDGSSETLTTERVMIAVGSSPSRPAHVDFGHPAIRDSTSILELERMPRSLVVVGGGVIGSEYASIFAEMGVDTTVIEPRNGLMRFLDEECRDALVDRMREAGIRFRFGSSPTGVHPGDDGGSVVLEDGERIEGEIVLWALGRQGNTAGLGLETVGIEVDRRGIVSVDEHQRTTAAGIWAAGDVVGFPALASTSMQQARIAVEDMFDLPRTSRISSLLPMGIYTIPAIASIGPTEAELRESGRPIVIGRADYRRNARGRMLGDDQGLVKLIFDRGTRTLLHASIIGEDATELVHLAMMALAADWRIEDFRDTCFTYPSLGALFKSAANAAQARLEIDADRTDRTIRRAA